MVAGSSDCGEHEAALYYLRDWGLKREEEEMVYVLPDDAI
jgi:hypothetical protein